MKIVDKREENTKEKRLPEVGEIWQYKNTRDLFMRILDEEGRRALNHGHENNVLLYCVDLGKGDIKCITDDGRHGIYILDTELHILGEKE